MSARAGAVSDALQAGSNVTEVERFWGFRKVPSDLSKQIRVAHAEYSQYERQYRENYEPMKEFLDKFSMAFYEVVDTLEPYFCDVYKDDQRPSSMGRYSFSLDYGSATSLARDADADKALFEKFKVRLQGGIENARKKLEINCASLLERLNLQKTFQNKEAIDTEIRRLLKPPSCLSLQDFSRELDKPQHTVATLKSYFQTIATWFHNSKVFKERGIDVLSWLTQIDEQRFQAAIGLSAQTFAALERRNNLFREIKAFRSCRETKDFEDVTQCAISKPGINCPSLFEELLFCNDSLRREIALRKFLEILKKAPGAQGTEWQVRLSQYCRELSQIETQVERLQERGMWNLSVYSTSEYLRIKPEVINILLNKILPLTEGIPAYIQRHLRIWIAVVALDKIGHKETLEELGLNLEQLGLNFLAPVDVFNRALRSLMEPASGPAQSGRSEANAAAGIVKAAGVRTAGLVAAAVRTAGLVAAAAGTSVVAAEVTEIVGAAAGGTEAAARQLDTSARAAEASRAAAALRCVSVIVENNPIEDETFLATYYSDAGYSDDSGTRPPLAPSFRRFRAMLDHSSTGGGDAAAEAREVTTGANSTRAEFTGASATATRPKMDVLR